MISGETEVLEVQRRPAEIQAAIMHVLDGRNHNIVFSESPMDITDPAAEKYLKRCAMRCLNSMKAKDGTFEEDSLFAMKLREYFEKKTDLCGFTESVCKGIADYFENNEAVSADILFIDFRSDDVPYIAAILMEETEASVCETETYRGRICNSLRFGRMILPPLSKPFTCFALVSQINGSILFADERKWKDVRSLIAEKLLQAEYGMSKKEAVETVKSIAYEIAQECEENPAILLSEVKSYISDTVNEGMPLRKETMVSELFSRRPEIREAFLKKAEEKKLPEEVELPKASVRASMKKQKISTDTGIEITFPAEYYQNPQMIEFRKNPDGSTTIEIRNVTEITGKI